MTTLSPLLLLLLLFLVSESLSAPQQHVVLISVDGMRTDYLWEGRNPNSTVKIPNLRKMMANGVLSKGARSVLPAMTFPAHTSMITAQPPAVHGIYCNCFDAWTELNLPKEGSCDSRYFFRDIKVPSIISLAAEAGLEVAGVDWPVTVGAPMQNSYPGNYEDPDNVNSAEFFYLTLTGKPGGATFQEFPTYASLYSVDDKRRGDLMRAYIKEDQPHLSMFHFDKLDYWEHEDGYMSERALQQIELIDDQIGQLLQTIEETEMANSTTVFVVSDHGFVNVTHTIYPMSLFNSLDLVGPVVLPNDVASGGILPVYLNPNATREQVDQLDAAIQFLQTNKEYGILAVYNQTHLHEEGAFPRAYCAIEADLNNGFSMDSDDPGYIIGPSSEKGKHGFSPENPQMLASFLVSGPGIKKDQTIDYVQLYDIGATVSHLLGLNLPKGRGRVVKEIFTEQY